MSVFDASRMLSFDLETTSANPLEARIVTSALVTVDGANTDEVEMLADPGVEIPAEATKIHGITTERARSEGRPHDDVLIETVRRIKEGWETGLVLVVYNAPFDLTVLRQLTGDFTVTGPVFDPFAIDRIKDRYRKGSRRLGDVAAHYGITLDNAHDATADALAAARVAWKQVNKVYPELKQMSTDDLMEFQTVQYYEMQENFKKYREARGQTADINTAWPMQA